MVLRAADARNTNMSIILLFHVFLMSSEKIKSYSTREALLGPSTKKAKTWYKQTFCDAWLQDPELKDWLAKDPTNKSGAFCSVCERKLKDANKTELMRHKATRKHVNTFKGKQNTLQVSSFFNKPAKLNTNCSTPTVSDLGFFFQFWGFSPG